MLAGTMKRRACPVSMEDMVSPPMASRNKMLEVVLYFAICPSQEMQDYKVEKHEIQSPTELGVDPAPPPLFLQALASPHPCLVSVFLATQ